MMLPLHAEDTLFYVFEADFRLHEHDCLVDTFALPQWVQPVHGGDSRLLASRRGTTYQRSSVHEGLHSARGAEGSEFLRNVTQFVTCAHRHGVGELVWLGWNSWTDHGWPNPKKGTKKHRESPHWGNQFIAYTRKAAKYMLDNWTGNLAVETFYDGALRRWLINDAHAEKVGASFAYPAFGGFKVHVSSNTPEHSPQCPWDNPDRQGGTFPRSGSNDMERWIGKFIAKGPIPWVAKVPLCDQLSVRPVFKDPWVPDLRWRTLDNGVYQKVEEQKTKKVASPPWRKKVIQVKRWSKRKSSNKPETKRQQRAQRKVNLQLGLRHFVGEDDHENKVGLFPSLLSFVFFALRCCGFSLRFGPLARREDHSWCRTLMVGSCPAARLAGRWRWPRMVCLRSGGGADPMSSFRSKHKSSLQRLPIVSCGRQPELRFPLALVCSLCFFFYVRKCTYI